MSQRTLPSLHEHDGVAVGPSIDAPEIRHEPPTPKSATVPVTPPVDRSRLGVVLALVGAGLLMQGAADALARAGHESLARPLFLCAISLLFAACAWRLTSAHAARRERVWVSLVLGLGLLASYVMHHPLQLDGFDELAHVGTLTRLLDSHTLFPTNSILPVSPYYPGLELATAATRWLTGLPLVVDQLIVLAAVRVVLVLVVFLVVERACHSSRAGGIGVLAYAASPQFYGFDAQYAYETIALAFAVAVVYLLFVSIDAARPKIGRSFVLALGCVGAVVFSHHVTGWFTVGFLVVWAVGLYLTAHPHRRHLTGWGPALALFAAPSARVSADHHPWCRRIRRRSRPHRCPTVSYAARGGGSRPASSASRPRSASSSAVLGPSTSVVFSPRIWVLPFRPRPPTLSRGTGQRSREPGALQERRGGRIPRLGDRLDPGVCHRLVRAPRSLALQRDLQAECSRWSTPLSAGRHRSPLSDLAARRRLVGQQAGGRSRHHVHLLRCRIGRWRVAGETDRHGTVG